MAVAMTLENNCLNQHIEKKMKQNCEHFGMGNFHM